MRRPERYDSHVAITQPFDLALSLEMGQAFRWQRVGDEGVHHRDWGDPPDPWRRGGGGWYSCVVGEYLVHIRQTDDGIEYRVGVRDGERDDVDLNQQLHDYFRLAASNLRAHSESEVGASVVTGGPHAAAISESSERQRAAKSRRCSARGIESPRPRRQRKYCRNSSNAEQKRAADAKLPKPRIG